MKTVYKQAKAGLAKYLSDSKRQSSDTAGIKLETVLSSADEEALVARGWSRPN